MYNLDKHCHAVHTNLEWHVPASRCERGVQQSNDLWWCMMRQREVLDYNNNTTHLLCVDFGNFLKNMQPRTRIIILEVIHFRSSLPLYVCFIPWTSLVVMLLCTLQA